MPLTKDDWTEAALVALARDGLPGVAVEPLARRLNATKGSFYWHFANRAELISATLELWERRSTTETVERIDAIADPRERLVALAEGAYGRAARGNAYAALSVAAYDPDVQAALARVTHTLLAFLDRLYRDLGVPAELTALYARLAYALYLGIGELRHADPDSDLTGPELESYLTLAVETIMPPDRTA